LPCSDEERQAAATLLAQHKGEYERIQPAFKQAALAQRTTALRSAADERRELLAGGDGAMRQRKLQAQADSVALAEDVTGGLRRTRQVRTAWTDSSARWSRQAGRQAGTLWLSAVALQ
jgi:hypothetical protein